MATSDVFGTPGTNIFTCPAGVSTVKVELWGAGGGSGGNNTTSDGGGGGGSGGYARLDSFSTTPGNLYTYNVGTGGPGASGTGNATAGGPTWWISAATFQAPGGLGGFGAFGSGSPRAGGAGGSSFVGTFTATRNGLSGGSGSNANVGTGGGGGGSGAETTAGTAGGAGGATGGTAGTAGTPDGGAGGTGGNAGSGGSVGNAPGGGAGGAGDGGTLSGGTGGAGRVKLTYTVTFADWSGDGALPQVETLDGAGAIGRIGTGALALQPSLAADGTLQHSGSGAFGAVEALEVSVPALDHFGSPELALLPTLAGEEPPRPARWRFVPQYGTAFTWHGVPNPGISGSGEFGLSPLLEGSGTKNAAADWSGTGAFELVAALSGEGVISRVGDALLGLEVGLAGEALLDRYTEVTLALEAGLSGEGSYSGYVTPVPSGGGRGRLWKHPKIVEVEGKLLRQDDEDWKAVLRALEAAERSAEKVLAKRVVRLGRAKESISEIRAEIRDFPQSTYEIERLKAKVTDSLAWLQRSRAAEYRRLLREIERKQREIQEEEDEWFLM